MQKWEYKIVWMDVNASAEADLGNLHDELNDLGLDGWELTGTVQSESGRYAKFIFKRPLS